MRTFAALCLACAALSPVAVHAQAAPAASNAAPEARMVIARQISRITVPDGYLKKIYAVLMPQLMEAAVRGQMGNAKFDEEMGKPEFQALMKRVSDITSEELTNLLTPYEGKLREAYAVAYSHQFDEAQLTQILAFYQTPTGTLMAQRAAALVNDPAVIGFQQEIGPAVADALPKLKEKIMAAMADLPAQSAGARL